MRRVTRDEAAELLGMKPTTFTMWFKRVAGLTFKQWVNETRVLAAIELIAAGTSVIEDVAFRVGFAERSTLERNFRRVTGMTVAEFKNVIVGGNAKRP